MGEVQRFFEQLASNVNAEALVENWWMWAAVIVGAAYLATRKPKRKN